MKNLIPTNFPKKALVLAIFSGLSFNSFAQHIFFPDATARSTRQTAAVSGQTIRPKSNSRINALISRPGNSQDFVALSSGSWQHEENSAYIYDSQGRLIQRLITNPTTGQNLRRLLTTYDAQGNEIEYREEEWVANAWVLTAGNKALISYNGQNLKTEVIRQIVYSGSNQWMNLEREQFAYDTNNRLTVNTYSIWTNGSWEFQERMNLSHVNGTATSAIMQVYSAFSSTWEDVTRAQNITWHVLYETPSAFTLQDWYNNTWVNMEKYSAVYDPNGGHIGVYEEWDDVANLWIKKSRETETYDNQRNFTGWKDETWDTFTSAWTVDSEEQEALTYSGIDVTQRIFRDTYNQNNILEDQRKEVYSNFQTFTVNGLKSAASEISVNVYPNPATGFINVILPNNNETVFTATISDITGKTWETKLFNSEAVNQINIENLPKGVYMLQLQTKKGTTVNRIVKQ